VSVRTIRSPAWLTHARAPQPRVLAALAAALLLAIAGWFWLRDSALVEVREVEVSGVSGPQADEIRAALEDAGRSMTTLHVRHDALDTAVEAFSIVKRLAVETDFPHTMRIHVVTNVAVGAVVVDGRRIAVTSDGTILRDAAASRRLPTIPARIAPAGPRLTEPRAVAAVAALASAPEPLRTRVEDVVTTPAHGLQIQIAHGPVLWFGSAERLAAKWAAAATVLADPQAAGARSIDVTVPERPAVAGLLEGGAPAAGESDVPTPAVGFETTPEDGATDAAVDPEAEVEP
jgi:cell division protein FtsQ